MKNARPTKKGNMTALVSQPKNPFVSSERKTRAIRKIKRKILKKTRKMMRMVK